MKSISRQLCYKDAPARNSRHNSPQSPVFIGIRNPLPRQLRVASGPTLKKGKLQGGAIPEWWNEK